MRAESAIRKTAAERRSTEEGTAQEKGEAQAEKAVESANPEKWGSRSRG